MNIQALITVGFVNIYTNHWNVGFANQKTVLDVVSLWHPIPIHPADAAERGIEDGDIVRIYNDRGAVICSYPAEKPAPKEKKMVAEFFE